MSNPYVDCSPLDGNATRCANPHHKKSALRLKSKNADGKCKWGRVWADEPGCAVCGTPVPTKFGMRISAMVLIGHQNNSLVRPKISPENATVFTRAVSRRDNRLCETCAMQVAPMVNWTTTPGQVVIGDSVTDLFVTVEAFNAAYDQMGEKLLALVDRIFEGEWFDNCRPRMVGGRKVTPCTVAVNEPSACLCGGHSNWRRMSALVRTFEDGEQQSLPFGDICAGVIRRAGRHPLDITHFQAIRDIRRAKRREEGALEAEIELELEQLDTDELELDEEPVEAPQVKKSKRGGPPPWARTPDWVRDQMDFETDSRANRTVKSPGSSARRISPEEAQKRKAAKKKPAGKKDGKSGKGGKGKKKGSGRAAA